LYVKPAFRKLQIGEELMYLAIQEAKNLGYPAVKLDTLASFIPAVNLYKKLGFKEIPPYNYNPFGNVLYMELNLDFPTSL
jgi:ribosomal protein S18 acetylase RimI-like enzyme